MLAPSVPSSAEVELAPEVLSGHRVGERLKRSLAQPSETSDCPTVGTSSCPRNNRFLEISPRSNASPTYATSPYATITRPHVTLSTPMCQACGHLGLLPRPPALSQQSHSLPTATHLRSSPGAPPQQPSAWRLRQTSQQPVQTEPEPGRKGVARRVHVRRRRKRSGPTRPAGRPCTAASPQADQATDSRGAKHSLASNGCSVAPAPARRSLSEDLEVPGRPRARRWRGRQPAVDDVALPWVRAWTAVRVGPSRRTGARAGTGPCTRSA